MKLLIWFVTIRLYTQQLYEGEVKGENGGIKFFVLVSIFILVISNFAEHLHKGREKLKHILKVYSECMTCNSEWDKLLWCDFSRFGRFCVRRCWKKRTPKQGRVKYCCKCWTFAVERCHKLISNAFVAPSPESLISFARLCVLASRTRPVYHTLVREIISLASRAHTHTRRV